MSHSLEISPLSPTNPNTPSLPIPNKIAVALEVISQDPPVAQEASPLLKNKENANPPTVAFDARQDLKSQHAALMTLARGRIPPQEIGKTEVERTADGEKIAVTITREKKMISETYKFIDASGTELGFMQLSEVQETGNDLYCLYCGGSVEENSTAFGYGEENIGVKLTKIYVTSLYSYQNKQYKGVGTQLMQIAIERSLQAGYGGRIILDAVTDSHGFHYKQGLRCYSSEATKTLEQELQQADAENRAPETNKVLGSSTPMYLPEVALDTWKAKIAAHPILT